MTFEQVESLRMWKDQVIFRLLLQTLMAHVLQALKVAESEAKPKCLLVGARNNPERQSQNNVGDVCIVPKDCKWSVETFRELLESIKKKIRENHSQNMSYEDICKRSVPLAVQIMINKYDDQCDIKSFPGRPVLIKDYHVIPVLQLPVALFERYPSLAKPDIPQPFSHPAHVSLIHAAVSKVLDKAYDHLCQRDDNMEPMAGEDYGVWSRSSDDIIRQAASTFMETLQFAIGDIGKWETDLFKVLNIISSLMYENTKGIGQLLLANPEDGTVKFGIKFTKSIPFLQYRWSRKMLQLASSGSPLIANCGEILGLGHIATDIDPWESQNVFQIDFLDHYHWRLSCGDEVMLVSKYGVPSLPQKIFSNDWHLDTYQ